ncbi:hypothetical protein NDN08_001741 [Rhodosorus marinus]|uniref:non-specific serine/threonine protein kinase n=1 Tax=Rhodosorus marinus TaxID=101924 RepID=A0AAV8UUH4_9RHOD|nr:hypothetical protein NDN08_001741 [Rhodosorus marinus]
MESKKMIEEFVSPVVKTTNMSEEWQRLVLRQPVVLSGYVLATFKKHFFAKDWEQVFLELRCTTLVFHAKAMGKKEELFSFPLEFSQVEYSDKNRTVTCFYSDKMSFTIKPEADKYKCWRESILCAAELQAVSMKDFEVLKVIGKGATGAVYLAVEKATGAKVAIKVMEKSRMSNEKALKRLINERLTLELVGQNPFFVKLHSAFQSEDNLYIVTEYCSGGDLEKYMRKRNYRLSLKQLKQIVAETVVALEDLHQNGIVYRDLKPENILLDSEGHVKLADFGLSKFIGVDPILTQSFCGTLGYMAPEVVEGKRYGFNVDKYSLGCLIFMLIVGRTPYYAKNREKYFKSVSAGRLFFPEDVPADAQSLIRSLMDVDGANRMSFDEVREHAFFSGVSWEAVYSRNEGFLRDVRDTHRERQMSCDSLASLERSRGTASRAQKEGFWDGGFPKVMAAMFPGEKKLPKNPTIPGFLFSSASMEGFSGEGSVVSTVSTD